MSGWTKVRVYHGGQVRVLKAKLFPGESEPGGSLALKIRFANTTETLRLVSLSHLLASSVRVYHGGQVWAIAWGDIAGISDTMVFSDSVVKTLIEELITKIVSDSFSFSDSVMREFVETRYFRSDTITVNGLTERHLSVAQGSTCEEWEYFEAGTSDADWGIRVWKRTSGGVETEITAGVPVAVVSRTVDGGGIQSNTWGCPETAMGVTDNIVVRVYMRKGGGAWDVSRTWITPQLNAVKLLAATWTIYYYNGLSGEICSLTYGTIDYNTRIENFKWG